MDRQASDMKNAMTIDVEDYFHVAAFADKIRTDKWNKMPCRVVQNTQKILRLFDRHNVKATFFVLGWVAERYPDVVQLIHSEGHEIACHGYSHQLIYKQKKQTFLNETRRAKDLLEDIISDEVTGYRAASYSITKQSLWALDILYDLGFKYDSSIVPVFHDLYGISDSPREPHLIKTPKGKHILEFPPTTLSLPGMNLLVAGGGYFRLYPYWFSKAALKWVNNHDKLPCNFYLHPWEVDPEQPRINGKWFSKFRHYNNLSKCYGRLDNLLNDLEFTTARDVLSSLNLSTPDLSSKPKPAMASE